ncbi:ACT11D09.5 [Cucumis melo var. makuwa]|uniref:ACT11D09.5 n=1 Tax=Cucumis melo var. makuwa TaxID=1194695 RepID=A0A5A7T7P6_CUCMM|nr:ACT11D09.5 [Cucumis melo var. makuwa]TYK00456.1 ACT11D09.5 [Cucumis melo var. makuwa]
MTNREMTEVASFLSLLEKCTIREERRDARVWNPNPSQGFSCKSLFCLLLDPAPLRSRSLMWCGGLRWQRKILITFLELPIWECRVVLLPQKFSVSFAGLRYVRATIEEILLPPPFNDKRCSLWHVGVCTII